MSKLMPLGDFRAVRIVLEPEDFAGGDGEPDPAPSDPVDKDTWVGITGLPDDVAIRTSDHNGKALGEAYTVWSRWLMVTGESGEPLFDPMLDAGDDLQNSIFNALHGYYRAGFSALRGVVDLMTIGACGSFVKSSGLYADWRSGAAEFAFDTACGRLSSEPMLDRFNNELRKSGQALFDAKDRSRGLAGGHARQWYGELCDYSHSRPGFTEGDLWRSNGPVYVPEVFKDWHRAWLHTVSLCAVRILLARPQAERAEVAGLFTNRADVVPEELRRAFGAATGVGGG